MYFVLSAFTSSPISLVATTKASAFSFTVCRLPHEGDILPNYLTLLPSYAPFTLMAFAG
jgi:hypothetical protein